MNEKTHASEPANSCADVYSGVKLALSVCLDGRVIPEAYSTDLYHGSLFGTLTLENYTFLFDNSNRADKPFLRTLFNSLFVSVTVTASVTVTSMLVGYALAKTEFWGKTLSVIC